MSEAAVCIMDFIYAVVITLSSHQQQRYAGHWASHRHGMYPRKWSSMGMGGGGGGGGGREGARKARRKVWRSFPLAFFGLHTCMYVVCRSESITNPLFIRMDGGQDSASLLTRLGNLLNIPP